MFVFDCYKCGKSMKAAESSVGKDMICPDCGARNGIPPPDGEPLKDPRPTKIQQTQPAQTGVSKGGGNWFYRGFAFACGGIAAIAVLVFILSIANPPPSKEEIEKQALKEEAEMWRKKPFIQPYEADSYRDFQHRYRLAFGKDP